jgi:hypothetical protein
LMNNFFKDKKSKLLQGEISHVEQVSKCLTRKYKG